MHPPGAQHAVNGMQLSEGCAQMVRVAIMLEHGKCSAGLEHPTQHINTHLLYQVTCSGICCSKDQATHKLRTQVQTAL
jgi:hypothetical protein